jgi:membrane associated rhomboid family serine protease
MFLLTHATLLRESNQYDVLESRTLSMAAVYPGLALTAAQAAVVDGFRDRHPRDWEQMTSRRTEAASGDGPAHEMSDLARKLDEFQRDSITANFAVYPPRRSAISVISASFLHRDWLHLIFNLCFFWLIGSSLEDVWGSKVYSVILLVSSLLGVWAFSLVYQRNLMPLIGATGMLATLMGFYVVRFPKITIQRGTALWVVRPHLLRFSSMVYVVFPCWLLGLIFWGKSAQDTTNFAYWSQACAFGFGAILAAILRLTGIESYVTQKVEAQAAWSVDPHIAEATERLQGGDLEGAIDAVSAQIAEKPYSVEAHEMLVSLYLRKGNANLKYLYALEGLCEVQLKAANPEAAWVHYENYLKAGGRKMPANTWFQLARFAENQGDWERAIVEYQEFAESWPETRASVLALISAGRIQLQQYNRRDEAKRLYTAAQYSRVPHSDWDEVIRKGLEHATEASTPGAKIR